VSIAGVAVELAKQLFADISSAKVVVIGAGEMGQLIVQHLLQIGVRNITVVNRSYDRGRSVAKQYGIAVRKWEEVQSQLISANIAIASATVQDYLFRKDPFKKIMDTRRGSTLLIIDIAVPRNFEPSINKLDGVYLYSVDDLSEVVEQNRKARERDIARGMEIVLENVADFMDWFGARDIGPLIGQMKEQFVRISQNELEQFFVGTRQEASIAKENGATEAARFVDSIVRQAEKITSELNNKEDKQS